MKKVDIERLISKIMIATTALLLIVFGMWMIRNGYEENLSFALYMPITTSICSAMLLLAAMIFVIIGFKRNSKYFEVAAWLAGTSVLAMLLKIHHEVTGLQINVGKMLPKIQYEPIGSMIKILTRNIDIYDIGYVAIPVAIVGIWIYAICRVLKK